MQTIAVNNEAYKNATEATVFGPFFVEDAPQIPQGGDIAGGAAGHAVLGGGHRHRHRRQAGRRARGSRCGRPTRTASTTSSTPTTGSPAGPGCPPTRDGEYRFWGLKPTPYPIPHDGPVGQMLAAVGRSPVRAAHLHFMVTAPGYRTLVTHIFVDGDPQLEIGDSVFGVKDSLIKRFEDQAAGHPHPGRARPGRPGLGPHPLRHRPRPRDRLNPRRRVRSRAPPLGAAPPRGGRLST